MPRATEVGKCLWLLCLYFLCYRHELLHVSSRGHGPSWPLLALERSSCPGVDLALGLWSGPPFFAICENMGKNYVYFAVRIGLCVYDLSRKVEKGHFFHENDLADPIRAICHILPTMGQVSGWDTFISAWIGLKFSRYIAKNIIFWNMYTFVIALLCHFLYSS